MEPSGWADEGGVSVEATREAQCAVSARDELKRNGAQPICTYPLGSEEWWSGGASIPGPSAFQADALPTELPDRELRLA
jgi:hypothetical protein